jgi:hypothetical protein
VYSAKKRIYYYLKIFSSIVNLVIYHASNRWTNDNTAKIEKTGRYNVEGHGASDLGETNSLDIISSSFGAVNVGIKASQGQ